MKAPTIEVRARRNQPLGMSPARFLADYWQKHPLLIRGAFPGCKPPLAPDDLAGLACLDGALARLIVHQPPRPQAPGQQPGLHPHRNEGRWKVASGPFDDATFAELPPDNWTLLVQDVDKWDPDTAALLRPFHFIPSWRIDDVMVSYAVDAGGVGAHVDQYDVFLIQGLGRRHWAIDTSVNPPTEFRQDVELKLLRQFSPTYAFVLEPGDVLYLPPGVPHDGVALGECMTFSVGMRAPAVGELLADLAALLAEHSPESLRLADPDLAPATVAGEIDATALARVRRSLGAAAATLDEDALGDWFGRFITRYRVAQLPAPRRRTIKPDEVTKRLAHGHLERDPWSRIAWRRRGRSARLYAAGTALDAPITWARLLASSQRTLAGQKLVSLPAQASGVCLLADLINAGQFTLHRS